MLLHHLQELDNDFRAGSNEDLTLSGLLGVVDRFERIVEDGCFDHFGGIRRFSRRDCGVRYLHFQIVSLHEPFERKECPRSAREQEGFLSSGTAVSSPSLAASAGLRLREGHLLES